MNTLVLPRTRNAAATASSTSAPTKMDPRRLAVTFPRVIHSEWVKFRSLRSNWTLMAATTALIVGVGAIAAAVLSGSLTSLGEGPAEGVTDATMASLAGMMLAQIIVGIVGVLAITSEFGSGMIRITFAAVPSRLPVLWAKAVVVAGVTFVIALPTIFATFFVSQLVVGSELQASISDDGVLIALIGSAGYLSAVVLLGLGLGSVLRQAAGAIGSIFVLLLVAPGLLGLVLPASWGDTFLKYLPSNASAAFTSVNSTDALLSPTMGALVVASWVVAFLGVAAVLLKRRDA